MSDDDMEAGAVYDIGGALAIYWPYTHPCHPRRAQWVVLTQEGGVEVTHDRPRDRMVRIGRVDRAEDAAVTPHLKAHSKPGDRPMTETTDFPYAVTVHRPGLPDVHLGFAFQHQAEHASWALTEDLRHTRHVEGTTITWSHAPEHGDVIPPVPTDTCALADLIAQEDLPPSFPDLYSRLKAQEGEAAAARIWTNACVWLVRTAEEAYDA